MLGLLLPTVHRMGLLLPGFLLAFALAWALHHWQEGALDRQRAGRQALLAVVFIGSYLFYLARLGLSPHTPSVGLFEIYLFQGDSLQMQVDNLMVHYGMRGGPLLLLALVAGGQLWQQGRQSLGIWLALAALALRFAVLLTNPAPICALDEADAPLDDYNVDRFCDLVAEIAHASSTRFLLITHHRLTMARMDRLYGVTMAERGVSQLVSVDLKTAETNRETA